MISFFGWEGGKYIVNGVSEEGLVDYRELQ